MPPEALTEPHLDISPKLIHRSAWRAVFSFPVVLAILLVVLTLFTVRLRFSDPDLWWHLKTGEIIWKTHSIPRVDPFSFTAYGHPWVAQEWLSEVTIYAAWKVGGYSGLMFWFCILAAALILGAYILCSFYSGNVKVAFVGGLITWLFSTVGLAIRPHMIGYLLLICELLILHLGRTRDPRWFFALPPLFAVWINCHGSFFFGMAVFAVTIFCSSLDFKMGLLVGTRWERRRRIMLLISFGFSVVALLVNPIGPKLLVYPLDVMLNQPLNLQSVSEWQQPNFSNGRALAFLAVAALIFLVPLLRSLELRFQEFLLVLMGFGFAVRHERMFFVFGILAAPILCRLLATAWDQYRPDRDQPWPNAVMVAFSLPLLVLAFPNQRSLEQQVENANPVKAVEFIQRSGISGRMLNEYIYGGYLIWAAPEHRVFIDGRADLYEPAGVLAEYGKWKSFQADPRNLLDKYHITFCLLSHENSISRVLPLISGWKKIYSDQSSVVIARSRSYLN